MFNNWRFWLGLGVSLVLLLILVYKVDPGEIARALRDANYVYVAPAILLYFVAVYFRALRWRYLLSPLRVLPASRLYPVVVIGYMANNLLPARLGELVRCYYLARREGVNASTGLATVVVERVYDGITLLAMAAVAIPALVALGEFHSGGDVSGTTASILAILMVSVFVLALGFLTFLAATPRAMEFVQWTLGLVPAKFRPRVRGLVLTFVQGLTTLASPRRHLGLFLLSLPVWLLEGTMYFLVSYSFGIDDYFDSTWVLLLVVALVTATSNLATSLPTAIGGIGPFEVVAQQTLVALGVAGPVGVAYAAFLHLVALWLPVNLVGLVLMWKQHLSLRQWTGAPRPELLGDAIIPSAESGGGPGTPLPLRPREKGGVTRRGEEVL